MVSAWCQPGVNLVSTWCQLGARHGVNMGMPATGWRADYHHSVNMVSPRGGGCWCHHGVKAGQCGVDVAPVQRGVDMVAIWCQHVNMALTWVWRWCRDGVNMVPTWCRHDVHMASESHVSIRCIWCALGVTMIHPEAVSGLCKLGINM
jgi:hypothetical protein